MDLSKEEKRQLAMCAIAQMSAKKKLTKVNRYWLVSVAALLNDDDGARDLQENLMQIACS